MRYTRLYVQYNDLVFDGVDMIRDADSSVSFKGGSQPYSYGHGAHRAFKNDYLYAEVQTISLTLRLNMKRLPCDERPYYGRYVRTQLTKPGKLWAVDGNELLWTNAVVTNISQDLSSKDNELEYDIDFELYDGIWRKADRLKTFLVPYDICGIFECNEFLTKDPCPPLEEEEFNCCTDCTPTGTGVTKDADGYLVINPNNCSNCVSVSDGYIVLNQNGGKSAPRKESCDCCCGDEIEKDMALCYHMGELQDYYSCKAPYQIVYDCKRSGELFGISGDKLCEKACSGIIAGKIYSETDIPTTEVDIVLTGRMVDPIIEINGNTNIIKGEYDGTLTIQRDGDVYYKGKRDCCDTLLSPSVWRIPQGNNYGWTVNPQWNRVIVNTNACCGFACAYIQHNALTF